MKPISAAFFFVLLTLLCVVVANAVAEGPPVHVNLIEQACQQSPHKDLCVSALQIEPNSKGADLTGLAQIAIKQAVGNASSIGSQLKILSMEAPGMANCMQLYSDSYDQLESSLAALSNKAYCDAEKWVNLAIAGVDSCEQSLLPVPKALAEPFNHVFRQLCQNAIAIIKATKLQLSDPIHHLN